MVFDYALMVLPAALAIGLAIYLSSSKSRLP
jgi:hypothetical protein